MAQGTLDLCDCDGPGKNGFAAFVVRDRQGVA
jgi:hypothetical protein